MKLTLLLLVSSFAKAETSDGKLNDLEIETDIGDRRLIVNGFDANTTNFPFFVTIENIEEGSYCGGTLIHPEFILSAAHCAIDPDPTNLMVYFGAPNFNSMDESMIKRNVTKAFNHQKYNAVCGSYDVTLLQIEPVLYDGKEVTPFGKNSSFKLDITNPPNDDTTYYLPEENHFGKVHFSANTIFDLGSARMHFILVMDDYNEEQIYFRKLYEKLKSNDDVEKISLIKCGDVSFLEEVILDKINEKSTTSSDGKSCCSRALETTKLLINLTQNEFESVIILLDDFCKDHGGDISMPVRDGDGGYGEGGDGDGGYGDEGDGGDGGAVSSTSISKGTILVDESDNVDAKISRKRNSDDNFLGNTEEEFKSILEQKLLGQEKSSPPTSPPTDPLAGAIIYRIAIGKKGCSTSNENDSLFKAETNKGKCAEVPDLEHIPDIFKSFQPQLEFKIDGGKYRTMNEKKACATFVDDLNMPDHEIEHEFCVRATAINLMQIQDCRKFFIAFNEKDYPDPFLLKSVEINNNKDKTEAGANVTVIGLGCTSVEECEKGTKTADRLQEVELEIVEEKAARIHSGISIFSIFSRSSDFTICAGNSNSKNWKGDWKGDSGGPLMIWQNESWLQVGIVSQGYENAPGIYTDTSHDYVYNWIMYTICKHTDNCDSTCDENTCEATDLPRPRRGDVAYVFSKIGVSLTVIAGGLFFCENFSV